MLGIYFGTISKNCKDFKNKGLQNLMATLCNRFVCLRSVISHYLSGPWHIQLNLHQNRGLYLLPYLYITINVQ